MVVATGKEVDSGIYWVEVRDASQCPRTASLPITKNDPAQDVSRAEAENPPESKPCEHPHLCWEGPGAPALQSCVLAEGMLKGPSPENLRSDD